MSQQAAVIAYSEDFSFLFILMLASRPLVLIIGSSRTPIPFDMALEGPSLQDVDD